MNCNQGSTGPEPGKADRFRACGEISLLGAKVGELGFRGARLEGKGGYALVADQITVLRSVYCDRGFCAHGQVSLAGASVRQLCLNGARLVGDKQPRLHDESLVALDAQDLRPVGTVRVGTDPAGVSVDPATNTIYVANTYDHTSAETVPYPLSMEQPATQPISPAAPPRSLFKFLSESIRLASLSIR